MKLYKLLFLLLLLVPFSGNSQRVDTLLIDGQETKVYPFKAPVKTSGYYYDVIGMSGNSRRKPKIYYEDYLKEVQSNPMIRDSMILTESEFEQLKKIMYTRSYRKLKKYYLPKLGPMPTKEEFKRYLEFTKKRKRRKMMREMGMSDNSKIMNSRKFKAAVYRNPYPLMLQSYDPDHDITPMLDPIPDGEYVQLFESYSFVDENGESSRVYERVAGRFSIKDNLLHGEATWFGIQGDTLKHGWFENGQKTGEWTFVEYDLPYMDDQQCNLYIERGYPDIDTTIRIAEFANGAKNGKFKWFDGGKHPRAEGYYTDDEESGEWILRESNWTYTRENGSEWTRNNELITTRYTLNDDDSLIVKPIVIRDGLLDYYEYSFDYEFELEGEMDPEEDTTGFDFSSLYELKRLPYGMYEPAFEREQDLDLEEEAYDVRDYGFESEYGEYGEYDYGWEEEFLYSQVTYYDENTEQYKKRGVIFDSIGAYPKYVGTYEVYYPNGQLAYKYEFENGRMKEEPVVYWDNGQIHDEVLFEEDSNRYVRNVYDYKGQLFKTMYYDSLGDYTEIYDETVYEEVEYEPVYIDGFEVYERWYPNSHWEYTIPDSLYEEEFDGPRVIYKSWSMSDTSVMRETLFYPETRTRKGTHVAINGKMINEYEANFSEDYKSWTGKEYEYFGDMKLETTLSASLGEWVEEDSVPRRYSIYRYDNYEVTDDRVLYRNDELYTGNLKLDFSKKKLAIKGRTEVDFPWNDYNSETTSKNYDKFLRTGKAKNELEISRLSAMDYDNNVSRDVIYNMFMAMLKNHFQPPSSSSGYDEYDYFYEEESGRSKDKTPRVEVIEGNLLDGKPHGTWAAYDQYGKVLREVPFEKGEPHGRMKVYDYAEPVGEYYYGYDDNDTFPEKQTYYLNAVVDFVNGKQEGKEVYYNWLGETVSEIEYKDGFRHGMSMERNSLATSYSEFKYGALDGYSRMYLTLPGKDSLLLFDLLFQNGLLQGESKSYHTNGNISKRGFFLSGEPIEDYEGYDSLGVKYHYVKFQYGFPVEEKIWEENELSVRYKFNWEDSIPFAPMDITSSESLESMLIKAGLGGGYEYQPYYGRPSLVEKAGIDYQLTKYYPNDTVARNGTISEGRKSGLWEYYSYEGEKLYEVDYFDSLIVLNDSIRFNSKGIYTGFDAEGRALYRSFIIEKFEKYDCSHKDHYETRQLWTIWEVSDTLNRMNGEVFNYYDNGTLQSYGTMKDGLPHGEWRYYDPMGKLNKYGHYLKGKRNGRWLSGDLSKTKYLGDICLNPNMPDLEEEIRYRENFLDISVINYKLGRELNREYYDLNMNLYRSDDEEETKEELEETPPPVEIIEEEDND